MADKKISEFAQLTALAAVDTVPVVHAAANYKATLGQIKDFVYKNTVITVTTGAIAPGTAVVKISGLCTLLPGLFEGSELTIVTAGTGKITAVGLLPQNGFTFTAGASLIVIWIDTGWIVLSSSGMTAGIV